MVSLVVFGVLFFVSLFAEFLANDRPLLICYDGAFYSPIFRDYPETTFGGDFPTNAVYTDVELQKLIAREGLDVVAADSLQLRHRADTGEGRQALLPPSRAHPLGTDDQARDVLARLIYGFRISVLFGLVLTILSTIIGIAAGAVQGYFGGLVDLSFQRFLEIWSSMPTLYLLIILASFIQPGFWVLLGIMLLFSWMALVGLVRAEFLRGRNFDYVRAARALGMLDARIMFRHILPNAMTASLTFLPFILAGSVTTLTVARLPGLRPAAGLAVAGRAAAAGQEQPQCAVARLHRLRHHRAHDVAAGVHRRGGARRLQPAQGAGMSEAALLEVTRSLGDLRRRRQRRARGARRQLQHRARRDAGAGGRIGLGQVGDGAVGAAAPALSRWPAIPPAASSSRARELVGAPARELLAVRGNRVSMIFQEPMTSLNPLHTIERQVNEVLILHKGLTRDAARKRTLELLEQVGIPEAGDAARRLSAPAVGRPAPAGDDRHGAGQRARPPDRRRADDRARRHHPGADPEAAEEPAGALRHGAAVHHPRSRHRAQDGRPGLRDDPGPRSSSRARSRMSSTIRSTPTPSTCCRPSPRAGRRRPIRTAPEILRLDDLKVHFPIKRGVLRRTVGYVKAVDGVSLALARRPHDRPGGRIRLGQDDARPRPAAAREQPRAAYNSTAQDLQKLSQREHAAAAPADADRLPGSVQLAQPAHVGGRDRRRRAGGPSHRQRGRAQPHDRRGAARSRASSRRRANAIRTNSPAASASASPSPAPWC